MQQERRPGLDFDLAARRDLGTLRVIGGRIRAYYDLVALAKAPDPQPVRRTAQGASGPGTAGMFSVDDRGETGHGPSIGCKIPFGVGKKPPKLPHAFYLGPCYIEPPAGSLTPDVDITPP